MTLRLAVLFLLGLAAVAAVRAMRLRRMVPRPLGTLAVVEVPAGLEPWDAVPNWAGSSLRLTRTDHAPWHMGSHTPYKATLVVTQFEPRVAARLGAGALREVRTAFEHVAQERWEGWTAADGVRRRAGEGRYTANTMDRPIRLVEAFDAARSLGVQYAVWASEASATDAAAVVDRALASYRLTGDLAAHFGALERELGGVRIALPVELWDPFPWSFDATGVQWMYFRRHRRWTDDGDPPERTIAVAAFFAPGDTAHAARARAIVTEQASAELAGAPAFTAARADDPTLELAEVVHGAEAAWLARGVDPARGLALAYRAWRRDATRDDALAVVRRALEAYTFSGDAAATFAPPPTR